MFGFFFGGMSERDDLFKNDADRDISFFLMEGMVPFVKDC